MFLISKVIITSVICALFMAFTLNCTTEQNGYVRVVIVYDDICLFRPCLGYSFLSHQTGGLEAKYVV